MRGNRCRGAYSDMEAITKLRQQGDRPITVNYIAWAPEDLLEMAHERGAEAGLHGLGDETFERLVTAWLGSIECLSSDEQRRANARLLMTEVVPDSPDFTAWVRQTLLGIGLGAAAAALGIWIGGLYALPAVLLGAFLMVLYVNNIFPFRRWYRRRLQLRLEAAVRREQEVRALHEARIASIREYVLATYHFEKARAAAVRAIGQNVPSLRAVARLA